VYLRVPYVFLIILYYLSNKKNSSLFRSSQSLVSFWSTSNNKEGKGVLLNLWLKDWSCLKIISKMARWKPFLIRLSQASYEHLAIKQYHLLILYGNSYRVSHERQHQMVGI
jgi:hypothetical protein